MSRPSDRQRVSLPPELFRAVRRLEVHAKKAVRELLAGQYASVFRGAGLLFEEVREYLPGDDIRSIDWNVTARMGMPYVKRYREERERTLLLLVDISASEGFGTGGTTKWQRVLEVAALIALSAVFNQDKVGMVAFSADVDHVVPPSKGMPHALRLLRDLMCTQPTGRGTEIAKALRRVRGLSRRHAIVFLISDFCAANYETDFRVVARCHDLIAVCVYDPRELELPAGTGLVPVRDPETGQWTVLDASSQRVRSEWAARRQNELESLRRLVRQCDADLIELNTDTPATHALVRFFRGREKRAALG